MNCTKSLLIRSTIPQEIYDERNSKRNSKSLLVQSTLPRQNRIINTKHSLVKSVRCDI